DGVPQRVVVQLDQLGLTLTAVDNARHLAGIAQTAARTRSLLAALESDEFHDVLLVGRPRPVRPGLKTVHRHHGGRANLEWFLRTGFPAPGTDASPTLRGRCAGSSGRSAAPRKAGESWGMPPPRH